MESEVTKAVTLAARITSFETTFEQIRNEIVKQIDLMEKRHSESEREQDRYRTTEREGMNKMLVDTRKMLDAVPKIEQDLLARKDEESRITKLLAELNQKITDAGRKDEERTRQMVSFEESRRQTTSVLLICKLKPPNFANAMTRIAPRSKSWKTLRAATIPA